MRNYRRILYRWWRKMTWDRCDVEYVLYRWKRRDQVIRNAEECRKKNMPHILSIIENDCRVTREFGLEFHECPCGCDGLFSERRIQAVMRGAA